MIGDQASAPANDSPEEDIVGGGADAADAAAAADGGELEQARGEAARNLAGWQRAQADYENLKRRSAQDVRDQVQRRQQGILLDLLDLADDFERALEHDAGESDAWRGGVTAIQSKLRGLLLKQGVQPIEIEGESFDPNRHEAVGQLPGEHNEIMAVLRRGYTVSGRVLRATQVMVGNGQTPPPPAAAPPNDD